MQGPRADFACLSKKCQQDGAATVYELPVAAKQCPVCGSKRIKRLYNAINIASGVAKKVDQVAEPAFNQAQAAKDQAQAGVKAHRVAPALGVPIGNLGATLGRFGGSAVPISAGKGQLTGAPGGVLGQMQRRPPRPDPSTSFRDREFKIGRDSSGFTVERA